MSSPLLPFIVALTAAAVLTVVVRSATRRLGMVDVPDGKRKLHKRPVSRGGGIAVYAAMLLGLGAVWWGNAQTDPAFLELGKAVAISAGIVCLIGAIDDYFCLRSKVKLLLQLLAVLPILAFGYWIDRVVIFGYPLELSWFGLPLTVLWLVGCINSLNLLDGMDGLASTTGLLAAGMLAVVATFMGHGHVAVIAVVLCGALAGFLVHNLPPASIFLGDSGSMVIGLVLGVLGIQSALKTPTTLVITVPAVVLSLPMLDTALAIVRRRLTGRGFDSADREHVHHRLLDRGLTQWQALCILGAFCLAAGAAATAATLLRSDALALMAAAALIVLVVRLRLFGHHEYRLARQSLAQRLLGASLRLASPEGRPRLRSVDDLRGAPWESAWQLLIDEARRWGAERLEIVVTWPTGQMQHCSWRGSRAERLQRPCQVGFVAHGPSGACCDLQATLDGPSTTSTVAIGRLLQLFAEYLYSAPPPPPVHMKTEHCVLVTTQQRAA
ncbi:MAG: MraY family glycosyltransferase [Planctomycetota bacterium]